jgi:hypothetical protein
VKPFARHILAWTLMATMSACASRPDASASRDTALGLSPTEDASIGHPALLDLSPEQIARQPWAFAEAQGVVLATPHYRIHTTIDDERILQRLPVFLERALAHYTSALADLPLPTEPLDTYLFRTRSQWQLKTQQLLPDQADLFSNLGRGGFTTRGTSVLYYIDWYGYTRDTFAIAAHEGWHQYTQNTFKHQLPIWLEEGVATYMEGYRTIDGEAVFQPSANRERRDALRGAVRSGQLISLDELLSRTPQAFLDSGKSKLLRYYAQVWALTLFLAEGEDGRYRAALSQLLKDAANGRFASRMMTSPMTSGSRRRGSNVQVRLGPAVLQEYFNADLSAFEKQFASFMTSLAEAPNAPRRSSN